MLILMIIIIITCPKVDNNIDEKDCVWETVKNDSADGEVVVEEGDGDREDDQVGNKEQQHGQVPVEPLTNKQFVSKREHPDDRPLSRPRPIHSWRMT